MLLVPLVLDIPRDLGTWCFAHVAPVHVLDWLARMFSLTEVVSNKSITKLFDFAVSGESDVDVALRAMQWWATRVPIEKPGHAARVKHAIKEAARVADICVLDWLWERVPLARFDSVLDGATGKDAKDPIRVIEWWVRQREHSGSTEMSLDQWMRKGQQNVIIEIGDTFIDSISGHGCLSVLNWWRDFGVVGQSQLEYTHRAIDSASEAGHLRILKWWQSSFPAKDLKYSELAMDKAASPAVLDWWLHESNLPLKFSSFATTHAARTNSRVNLDWWLAHTDQLGFQFLPTTLHDTMDRIIQGSARRGSRDDLANWVTMTWFAKHWRETGQVISQGFLLRASMDPNKAWFLEWWSEQGLPVERVVPEAIKYASTKQWSAIVSWWNKQVNEMRDRKTVGNEEATEKHPAVVRHERECMQMLQAMLEGMDPAAVPVP